MFGKPVVIAAFVIFPLAVIHPAHGTGYNLCLWHGLTDMPCPGCGLSRSVSCIVRGDIINGIMYHPFGIIVAALLAIAMLVAVLPTVQKRFILRRLLRKSRLMNAIYIATVASFLAFGVLRAVSHAL